MKDTIKHTYLAADFGGGSGRIIAGFLCHGKLELEEVYRFSNQGRRIIFCLLISQLLSIFHFYYLSYY
ncbi:hypothetical protein FMM78_09085 [Bacteroides caecimuris]|nr:hypothetical protein [Bacteroides caecimuris]